MAEQKTPETLEIQDATVSLWRNCKLQGAMQGTCDRMIVDHKLMGNTSDVVIFSNEDGRQNVQRVLRKIEVPSGRGGFSFEDLPADEQKRLLAIRRMFKE